MKPIEPPHRYTDLAPMPEAALKKHIFEAANLLDPFVRRTEVFRCGGVYYYADGLDGQFRCYALKPGGKWKQFGRKFNVW